MEMSSLQIDPWASGASVEREKLFERQLIGEIVRRMLLRGRRCEVLRAEFDASGHDVLLESDGVSRHVQLKAMRGDGRRMDVNIHTALAAKPSGCVIWMLVDPANLTTTGFLWFGGRPGEPLPPLGDRVVKHTKANADGVKTDRPGLREVRRSRFEKLQDIDQLIERLFGTAVEQDLLRLKRHLRQQPLTPANGPAWMAHLQAGRFEAFPERLDDDGQIALAHLVDGYALMGLSGPAEAEAIVAAVLAAMDTDDAIFPSNLWAAMFLEHRRLRFEGREPIDEERERLQQMEAGLRRALLA